ncbi:ABC transporter permease [Aureibacillus halotolerans]|uniref:ABC-2 family transporter n=1 Tax=Aureibacillus halotolerans TaxID=1508390 RepID=A0A4R6TRH3_9BACI|nr:ABC transporter permease [Aureibacillus halotolerans]TDQ34625.1 hypothetical protein EV213_12443 [Aureibacillus halotolerans]
MFRVLKLELKKDSVSWYWKGAVIANLLIVSMLTFILYMERMEGSQVVRDMEELFFIGGTIVRAVFIVFAAVLLAKLIIEEYKNKTMALQFLFPIERKKLLSAKLLIVFSFTLTSILLSELFVTAVMWGVNGYFHFVEHTVTTAMLTEKISTSLTLAFAAAGTSLVPLYFGMRRLSVPVTIVSSLVIVSLISSHNPTFSLASIVYIPIAFAVIGIAISLLSIRNVNRMDVL